MTGDDTTYDLEDIRRQLASLARDPRRRRTEFTIQRPTKFRPNEVWNPETQMPFTERGAWHFTARLLENGCKIEAVSLRKPPGAVGWVILTPLEDRYGETRDVYIKLQLCDSNRILGRSFHYSV